MYLTIPEMRTPHTLIGSFIVVIHECIHNTCTVQSSIGELGDITGIEGQSGKNMCQGDKPDTG